jgi:hypothetical protein
LLSPSFFFLFSLSSSLLAHKDCLFQHASLLLHNVNQPTQNFNGIPLFTTGRHDIHHNDIQHKET